MTDANEIKVMEFKGVKLVEAPETLKGDSVCVGCYFKPQEAGLCSFHIWAQVAVVAKATFGRTCGEEPGYRYVRTTEGEN